MLTVPDLSIFHFYTMKKVLLILIPLLGLFACTNENMPCEPVTKGQTTPTFLSADDAINLANLIAEDFDCESRSQTRKAVNASPLKMGTNSRNQTNIDSLLYVVNYDNNAGYAIISRLPIQTPVLAVIDNGVFNLAEAQTNPIVAQVLEYGLAVIPNKGDSLPSIIKPMPEGYTYSKHYPPLLEVEWGQDYPEGIFCPNKKSGCVQTAIAQIMSYFEYPTSINLTYPQRDKTTQELNWKELKKHKKSIALLNDESDEFSIGWHYQSCTATEESHKALGRLCRELGHRNNAMYYPGGGTGATAEAALQTLTNILTNRTVAAISTSYYNFLNYYNTYKAIAIMFGTDSSIGGHAWVCDGGHYYKAVRPYHINGDLEESYLHFNWGLCGDFNGYFLQGTFDPFKGVDETDLPKGDSFLPLSRTSFSENVKYILIY